MKAEFELNVNRNGEPVIKVRVHEKDASLEQKLLSLLIEKGKENGLKVSGVNGLLSNTERYHNYEIEANPEN